MSQRPFPTDSIADLSAIGLSGLCMLHCLGGLLLGAALFGLGFEENLLTHALLLGLALPLALWTLRRGYRLHRSVRVLLLAGGGLLLMLAGLLLHDQLLVETLLTVPGVLLLAAAHLTNRRLLRRI
jgi:hypothetical protein